MSANTTFLTLREASDLGYGSVSTLRRRIRSGALQAFTTDDPHYRVKLSDLQALKHPLAVSADPREATEAAIARAVASAPPLGPERVSRLAALLASAA